MQTYCEFKARNKFFSCILCIIIHRRCLQGLHDSGLGKDFTDFDNSQNLVLIVDKQWNDNSGGNDNF